VQQRIEDGQYGGRLRRLEDHLRHPARPGE
jgi:hypothetical protein